MKITTSTLVLMAGAAGAGWYFFIRKDAPKAGTSTAAPKPAPKPANDPGWLSDLTSGGKNAAESWLKDSAKGAAEDAWGYVFG